MKGWNLPTQNCGRAWFVRGVRDCLFFALQLFARVAGEYQGMQVFYWHVASVLLFGNSEWVNERASKCTSPVALFFPWLSGCHVYVDDGHCIFLYYTWRRRMNSFKLSLRQATKICLTSTCDLHGAQLRKHKGANIPFNKYYYVQERGICYIDISWIYL